MFSLKGKTALITGAGSGIGQATALAFAKQGAQIAVIDRNESAAQQTADAILAEGGMAIAYGLDVTNLQQLQAGFDHVAQMLGRPSLLVNNAGISHIGNLETTAEADFDRVYAVNVKGTFLAMQAAMPHLLAGGGAIVNLASIAAVTGIADRFAYSMTKGAVHAMTLAVARDYIDKGVRCNCISPGRVHTPFVDDFLAKNYPGQEQAVFDKLAASQPIGRMGTPAEMASLMVYLCSDEAGFVTGCNYFIDGGFITLKM